MPVNFDARLTRKQAADRIGLTPEAIGMWRSRGHIKPGQDGKYRLGDVLEVERKMRYSPKRRRRIKP